MQESHGTIKLPSLNKRIRSFAQGYRQNIAILGDDAEEISYLIEDHLKTHKLNELTYLHTTTAYAGPKEFLKAIAFSLLSDCIHKIDSLDNLINCASPSLPSTTDFIKECLKKNSLTFLDALELIDKFINESGRRCVLIIEEFLGLTDLFDNVYQEFSKFIILQRNCMVVLCASCPREAEKILVGELNLLFGNFEKLFLDERLYLNNFLYLRNLLSPLKPSPFFLSFFVNILGSNTIYCDLIAKSIKEVYIADDEEGSIMQTLATTLYAKETYFFQKFTKRLDFIKISFKDFLPTVKLLLSLAQGYLRKKELASLGIYDPKELGSRLQKLLDLNYIENLGNIYKIKDPMFSFWLVSIFKLYFLPPVLSPSMRKTLFRKKIEEEIAIFKDEFFKDKLKKVLQLFSSFKNDSLRLGKDRYKLPSIENAKIISCPQNDFHLLVGEGKEIIFAGIKEKNVEDNDIFDFIEKGSNIKGKRVKKIFVSLDNLPDTARLIAKNNKLIIWDINDVNRLLNIYNRPIVSNNLNYVESK